MADDRKCGFTLSLTSPLDARTWSVLSSGRFISDWIGGHTKVAVNRRIPGTFGKRSVFTVYIQ
jgi:hypothetical protein